MFPSQFSRRYAKEVNRAVRRPEISRCTLGGFEMAVFNGFKGTAIAGLAIGVGAVFVGPALLPVFRTMGKPLAKAAMKAGILAYEQARVAVAELGEVTED